MAREGFDPTRDIPTARGRRDPELAIALGLESGEEHSEALDEADGSPLAYPGEVLGAKTTICIKVDGRDCWFTYEAKTRVQEGESEDEASGRTMYQTNVNVLQLADDMEERIAERNEAKRTQRIVPNG